MHKCREQRTTNRDTAINGCSLQSKKGHVPRFGSGLTDRCVCVCVCVCVKRLELCMCMNYNCSSRSGPLKVITHFSNHHKLFSFLCAHNFSTILLLIPCAFK